MNCTDFVRRPDPELIQLVSTLERRWGLREMFNAAAEVLVCRSECTLSDDWQAAIRALIQAANLEPYDLDRTKGGAK